MISKLGDYLIWTSIVCDVHVIQNERVIQWRQEGMGWGEHIVNRFVYLLLAKLSIVH